MLPATEVEFAVKGGTVILRKARATAGRGARLLEAMRGKATTRLSADQIMALTRNR